MSMWIARYRESDLVKLDIQINGDRVDPLSTIVHKDKVTSFINFNFIIFS